MLQQCSKLTLTSLMITRYILPNPDHHYEVSTNLIPIFTDEETKAR